MTTASDNADKATPAAGVSRRAALARLGIGASLAYMAPVLMQLSGVDACTPNVDPGCGSGRPSRPHH